MTRRFLLVRGALAAALVAAAVAVAVLAPGGDEQLSSAPVARPDSCRGFAEAAAHSCWVRELTAVVGGRADPRPAVTSIARLAADDRGYLRSNCHAIMHTVGRSYARQARVTLRNLMDHLPRSNDPGCAAGFAHGLVTAVAPDIDVRRPAEAAEVCSGAGTRYQRYSCIHGFGHAFMRIYDDQLEPALHLCTALGSRSAADCAQGAYHDYWFAVVGADDAALAEEPVKDPRRLCGAQPGRYVRPCWYRAFLENRGPLLDVATAADLDGLCDGLRGVQRGGCITGAALIGPSDPAEQLRICARLPRAADAADCVRGTKVQNLIGGVTSTFVTLVDRCHAFARAARAACYRWLGKAVAVLTDGRFGRVGCPRLSAPAGRRACAAGARSMEDALATFS